MNIFQEVLNCEEFLIAERRHFHINAEPSACEVKTMEHIDGLLTEWGIAHDVVPEGGILGYIQGRDTGRTVLLRADCDALRMDEYENNLKGPKVCVSANKGICHACGHDGHMATLLTATRILNAHKDELEGRVIVMFERGEEGTHNVMALHRYMEENKIHVDSCYGSHLYNALKTGEVALLDGPVMSGNATFGFTIIGRGGHGSRPDLSVSPVDCFVAIYNAMNALRMRNISPFNTLTFSVGTVHAGTLRNVIPDELSFSGTIRVFNLQDGKDYKKRLLEVIENTCKAYECTYRVDNMTGPFAAVINDPECAALARKAAAEAIGADKLVTCEPWMASESFALSQSMWPGVFGLVGMANPEVGSGAAHHNGAFDVDEAALKYAAACYIAYAKAFLASDLNPIERGFKGSFAELYKENSQPESILAYLRGETPLPDLFHV